MNPLTTMTSNVESYLAVRRQAGYALEIEGQQLLRFARFADDARHQGPLTLKLAIRWATASKGQRMLTAARRIEVLRGFARYYQQFEPTSDVPPSQLFGPGHRRRIPHIYSDGEIRDLLTETTHLSPAGGLRADCCATLFGLLAAAGLRLSEATGLARGDVDLEQGLLHIRAAKLGKSRLVPMHASTTRALAQYVQRRDLDPRTTQENSFFVGDYGRPARRENLEYAFRILRRRLGWKSRGEHPAPRLHDLRHTFICRTLQRWYETGVDIDRSILALSTYVGHAKVTDTYWYVTATPELMSIAAQRFEDLAGRKSS